MRQILAWKSVLLLAAIAAINLTLLRAQDTPPQWSTPTQLELLDKITGVSRLKFGATLDSFDKGELKPTDNQQNGPNPTQHFIYTPSETITWGTLAPADIEFEFYYNQLIGIRLAFTDTNANLISVYQAFIQKYGQTQYNTQMYLAAPSPLGGYLNAQQWSGSSIRVSVDLPHGVPQQADESFLDTKVTGAVEIIDLALRNKLTEDKQNALRNQLQKSQNLDKIKADL
jgi:hypothetical protein